MLRPHQPFLIVGQAPNQHGDPRRPLEGKLGEQLCHLFGCSWDEYCRHTQRFNVLPGWPGKQGKGDKFPRHLAQQNASRMRWSFAGCSVLFVGVATAALFGVKGPTLRWKPCKEPLIYLAAVLPHPSGINRWWNNPTHRRAATRFMRSTWRRCHV